MHTHAVLLGSVLSAMMVGAPSDGQAATGESQAQQDAATRLLPGFSRWGSFDEQATSFTVNPGIHVFVDAPCELETSRPLRLIFYALPNGNTTEQTIGRKPAPGLDWHFQIQHIGAQVRRLRHLRRDQNIIVAYLEAEGRSWPAWRKKAGASAGQYLSDAISEIESRCTHSGDRVTLNFAAHSGGGTLLFSLLDGETTGTGSLLPPELNRIALLDADYAYDDAKRHGEKLAEWLRAGEDHHLTVVCYDDRNIVLNGKKVLSSPEAGTYGHTLAMLQRLKSLGAYDGLTSSTTGFVTRVEALGGCLEILIHSNPENKILHTVLVEKNGLVHALTTGESEPQSQDRFFGEPGYSAFIE